jgi:hypothetical protein
VPQIRVMLLTPCPHHFRKATYSAVPPPLTCYSVHLDAGDGDECVLEKGDDTIITVAH